MKRIDLFQILCNSLFMAETIVLFFLACAALQGTMPFLTAIGYGAASFFGSNLIANLLLVLRRALRRAHRLCQARPALPLRVVQSGGPHAA